VYLKGGHPAAFFIGEIVGRTSPTHSSAAGIVRKWTRNQAWKILFRSETGQINNGHFPQLIFATLFGDSPLVMVLMDGGYHGSNQEIPDYRLPTTGSQHTGKLNVTSCLQAALSV